MKRARFRSIVMYTTVLYHLLSYPFRFSASPFQDFFVDLRRFIFKPQVNIRPRVVLVVVHLKPSRLPPYIAPSPALYNGVCTPRLRRRSAPADLFQDLDPPPVVSRATSLPSIVDPQPFAFPRSLFEIA